MQEAMHAVAEDDPRRLRLLLDRACDLAREHAVPSVVVGLAAEPGEVDYPDFVEFLQSALRVEDSIFRMTRERSLLLLADVDQTQAHEVIERLIGEYVSETTATREPSFEMHCFEVKPGEGGLRVRDVLTQVFPGQTLH